ncbi:MAG TPA: protein kinase [Terriglobales bacterium]|nr:protein kinase [Terriglobales bacterium]
MTQPLDPDPNAGAAARAARTQTGNESGEGQSTQAESIHAIRSMDFDSAGRTGTDAEAPLASSPPASRFAPGTILLNRFEVIRYIARGGMGEVYEVVDRVVDRTMALKKIVPEVAHDSRMIEQLKQEINNARNVTHPNVCRVFEVFEDGQIPPGYLLTMELLEGETLAALLRRNGPMTPDKLMPIIRQMAAGLEAVHKAGIVHQDFKTANVMLVKTDEDDRVVVTDFGLAVNLRAKDGTPGMAGGTPAYMSPEQAKRNNTIDKRADIYAFGVVIYELLTDHFPVEGRSASEVMDNKQHTKPIPPSKYCSKLPGHWERTVLRCLEIEPEKRFSTVDEVIAALEQRAEKRKRRKMILATAALVLAVIAGVGGSLLRRYLLTHRTPSLAVVGVTNQGKPNFDYLATEITESLSQNLSTSKDMTVTSSDDVSQIKGEFPALMTANLEREDLSGFRQATGADYLIVGHYSVLDPASKRLAIDLRVLGPKGETVGSLIHFEGAESETRGLIAHSADEIRKRLGTMLLPEMEAEEAANIYPTDIRAKKLYFEGLSSLRSMNAGEALKNFKSAANIEDKNAATHEATARAFMMQKSFGQARLEAQKAQQLAEHSQLPRETVMLLESRTAEIEDDWPNAIQKLDALYQLSRDKAHYGLLLARAQVQGMRSADALNTLSALKKLPPPAGDDPRIPLTEAQAYSVLGDYPNEAKAAVRALSLAKERNWKLMQATANLELCWAQQRMSNVQAAMSSCNDAHHLFETSGDPVNAAVVLNNIANWQVRAGNLEQARDLYQTVIKITANAEDKMDNAGAHLNLAGTLLRLNDYDGAGQHVEHALEMSSRMSDSYDTGRAHLIRAEILRSKGNLQEAMSESQQALDVATQIQDRDTQASAWSNLALYRRSLGQLDPALDALNHALTLRKDLQDKSGIADSLEQYGDISFQKGELDPARRYYNDAIAQRDQNEKAALAQLWLSLAMVEAETGDGSAALKHAWSAAEEYKAEKDDESRVDALASMLHIAVSTKDMNRAQQLDAELATVKPEDQEVQDDLSLARAEYALATHNAKLALDLLEGDLDQKTYLALNRRLVHGRALRASGERAKAASELAAVHRDAMRAGFKLLASKALAN